MCFSGLRWKAIGQREKETGKRGGKTEEGREPLLTCSLCPLPSPSHWSNRIETKRLVAWREEKEERKRKQVTGEEKGKVETCARLNLKLFQLGSRLGTCLSVLLQLIEKLWVQQEWQGEEGRGGYAFEVKGWRVKGVKEVVALERRKLEMMGCCTRGGEKGGEVGEEAKRKGG